MVHIHIRPRDGAKVSDRRSDCDTFLKRGQCRLGVHAEIPSLVSERTGIGRSRDDREPVRVQVMLECGNVRAPTS